METIKLNNGVEMPRLGCGVYLLTPDECEKSVSEALKLGYRLIDTAQVYGNEQGVGNAVAKSGIDRKEIFITTKLWITNFDYDKALKSIDESLKKLQTDYVDLILLHQEICDRYSAYRALETLYKEGKARAIGVSNFTPEVFVDFAANMEIKPAVNQLDVNVFTQRPESRKILAEYDCRLEAWSPLCEGRNNFFTNEVLARIGAKYGKSVSQVGLRWLIQIGAIAIPRSTKLEHLKENIEIFDFSLDDDDMAAIAKLDTGKSLFFDYHDPAVVKEFLSWIGLA